MSHIANVARKFRRALRNDTGVHFSLDELRTLAGLGALDLVTRAENQELCPPKAEAAEADATSKQVAMAPAPSPTGKTRPIPKELGMTFIDALKLGY